MALVNPVYAFFVPFLFVVTVPLALFAGLTTLLAFSVLIFRVAIVYLDIAISLVPQSITGIQPGRYRPRHRPLLLQNGQPPQLQAGGGGRFFASRPSAAFASPQSPAPSPTSVGRRRRRRPSSASIVSNGTITPGAGAAADGSFGFSLSLGPERDYEGVGGWRVGDDGDDEVWTTINSRLELPDRHHHHYRSASGGGVITPGDGGFLTMKGRPRTGSSEARPRPAVSPNCSRARTPTGSRSGHSDGYFPLTLSPMAAKKQSPSAAATAD
jgi:hypothetical protein